MTNIDIYAILESKPHNPHYLKRYWNFIQRCAEVNKNLGTEVYTESHHICPKSKDLFLDYKCFRKHAWNKIVLTARQHFLAHWMLFKAYRNQSTAYSLRTMSIGQSNRYQSRSKSKNYELIKRETTQIVSESRKGIASYKDSQGNSVTCSTTDPRVLSGELISNSKGRRYKWKTHDAKTQSRISTDNRWKSHPVRTAKLYFLEFQITLEYTRDNLTFLPYLEQGWQFGQTKEHKKMVALESNKTRSSESRKKAGNNISKKIQIKKEAGIRIRRESTKEERKNLRKGHKNYTDLFYDKTKKELVIVDILEESETIIKCFTKTKGRIIWDSEYNKRFWNKNVPIIPEGFYEEYPLDDIKIFDTRDKRVRSILSKDFDKINQAKILAPNGDRLSFFEHDTDKNVYLTKEFVEQYGIPLNLYKFKSKPRTLRI